MMTMNANMNMSAGVLFVTVIFSALVAEVNAENNFGNNSDIVGLHDVRRRGCSTIKLPHCKVGEVPPLLSSTDSWYRLATDHHVFYTFGIVFVEKKSLTLPIAVTGATLDLSDNEIKVKSGSMKKKHQDDESVGEERTANCLHMNTSAKTVKEQMGKEWFENFDYMLPNWLTLSYNGKDVFGTDNVKIELLAGRHITSGACAGAPLEVERTYVVVQLGKNFVISVYGQSFSEKFDEYTYRYCVIIDICQTSGNAVFIMIPEPSRNILNELDAFRPIFDEHHLNIRPIGVGLSIDSSINTLWKTSEVDVWMGEETFALQTQKESNIWFAGDLVWHRGLLKIEGNAFAFITVRNLQNIIDSVYVDELHFGFQMDMDALIQFGFITLEAAQGNVDIFGSINGVAPMKYCAKKANPSGIFFNLFLKTNPFQDISILNLIVLDIHTLVQAFVVTDSVVKDSPNPDNRFLNQGLGLRFVGSINILGATISEIELELINSYEDRLLCDRYLTTRAYFHNERVTRIRGTISNSVTLTQIMQIKGGGEGFEFAAGKDKFLYVVVCEVFLLGIQTYTDVYISNIGVGFEKEVRIFDVFKAQLEVGFKSVFDISTRRFNEDFGFTVQGRFVADANDNGDFTDTFQSALTTSGKRLADDASERINGGEKALSQAQKDFENAQKWLQEKKQDLDKANADFDNAVRNLGKFKAELENAKEVYEQALDALSKAQTDANRVCKIQSCSKVCVPGLRFRECTKTVFFLTVKYPCTEWDSCLTSIEEPLCVAANGACTVVRESIIAALNVAKAGVTAPLIALDAAKKSVSAAQFLVDKSKVVVDVAQRAMTLAQSGFEATKAVAEGAKIALEAIKKTVRLGIAVLDFLRENAIGNIFDVRNCGFEMELLTPNVSIFDVFCDINPLRLGFRQVRIRIDFKDAVSSIWKAAVATVNSVLQNMPLTRKRRDVQHKAFDDIRRLIQAAKGMDETHFDSFLKQTSYEDVVPTTAGFKKTPYQNGYYVRKDIYEEKCLNFKNAHSFLSSGLTMLMSILSENGFTEEDVSEVRMKIKSYDINVISNSISCESIGLNVDFVLNNFNVSASQLLDALRSAQSKLTEDPLLLNVIHFANEEMSLVNSERDDVGKFMILNHWISIMNNYTLQQHYLTSCASFLDCSNLYIGNLIDLFMTETAFNKEESLRCISEFKHSFYHLIENSSYSAHAISTQVKQLTALLERMESLNLFCSRAPEMVEDLKDVNATMGETISLVCNATGEPTPSFTWYKDGSLLPGESNTKLVIYSASLADSGTFYCVAGNIIANLTFQEIIVTISDVGLEGYVEESVDDEGKTTLTVAIAVSLGVAVVVVVSAVIGVRSFRRKRWPVKHDI